MIINVIDQTCLLHHVALKIVLYTVLSVSTSMFNTTTALQRIKEVAPRRARLVLRWVTVHGTTSLYNVSSHVAKTNSVSYP